MPLMGKKNKPEVIDTPERDRFDDRREFLNRSFGDRLKGFFRKRPDENFDHKK